MRRHIRLCRVHGSRPAIRCKAIHYNVAFTLDQQIADIPPQFIAYQSKRVGHHSWGRVLIIDADFYQK